VKNTFSAGSVGSTKIFIKQRTLRTILQHEERCLLRNAHMFQGLDTLATHITHGGNNFKYCTLAGMKKLTSASPFMLP
jgi:hypothetical protein